MRALERVAPQHWREMRARADAGLARLLGETTDEIHSNSAADSGFQVYDAVTQLLTGIAHERPTLVVLEDLHWADLASLRLLDSWFATPRWNRSWSPVPIGTPTPLADS
jgi:hypothetical protein